MRLQQQQYIVNLKTNSFLSDYIFVKILNDIKPVSYTHLVEPDEVADVVTDTINAQNITIAHQKKKGWTTLMLNQVKAMYVPHTYLLSNSAKRFWMVKVRCAYRLPCKA